MPDSVTPPQTTASAARPIASLRDHLRMTLALWRAQNGKAIEAEFSALMLMADEVLNGELHEGAAA